MARRIEQIQRNRRIRKTKESILFEFEGKNKTEEIYFKNFQKRENLYNIKFAYVNNTDPVGMIKCLANYMKREDISKENGDKVYCVFDSDLDINKQQNINEAIKLAKKNGIEIIISTPCFEFWYRLHYSYTSKKYISNQDIVNDLKNYISEYEKNMDVYELIKDKTDIAIKNAKKLEKEHIEFIE